jgi:hypothetical protein
VHIMRRPGTPNEHGVFSLAVAKVDLFMVDTQDKMRGVAELVAVVACLDWEPLVPRMPLPRRCALPACAVPARAGESHKLCARCRGAAYCCVEHQRQDWQRHKVADACTSTALVLQTRSSRGGGQRTPRRCSC